MTQQLTVWANGIAVRFQELKRGELLRQLRRDEAGQGLVEYALIITFVALVAIAGLTTLGNDIKTELTNLGGDL